MTTAPDIAPDILYEDSSSGVIIRARPPLDNRIFEIEQSQYFIRLYRCGNTAFRIMNSPTDVHPWQHKIVMDIFKAAGFAVKHRIPNMKDGYKVYGMTNKKQKFQFLLKYGRYTF
jgi:hypothetical protein